MMLDVASSVCCVRSRTVVRIIACPLPHQRRQGIARSLPRGRGGLSSARRRTATCPPHPRGSSTPRRWSSRRRADRPAPARTPAAVWRRTRRSEEHTSELQSLAYLVCRLLLEKKKQLRTYVA